MKKLFRNLITNTLAIILITHFNFILHSASLKTSVTAALTFTLVYYLAKPILHLLWLPINLLTLGLLSWVPFSLTLLFSITITQGVWLRQLTIPRTQIGSFHLPSIHFGTLSSLIIITFTLILIKKTIRWAMK